MRRPPALTEAQKRRYGNLRSQLLQACKQGDLLGGKLALREIRDVLLPSGHNMKYYEMVLSFCEMLILQQEYKVTNRYLKRVLDSAEDNTRIFQEASVLMAICKLHMHELELAELNLKNALASTAIINSDRRKDFLEKVAARFKEEALVASLGDGTKAITEQELLDGIQANFMSNISDDELFKKLGESVPKASIDFMRNIHDMAKNQLGYDEKKMLPAPPDASDSLKIGKILFSAISKRLRIIICPEDSYVRKLLEEMQDPKNIALAIMTEMITYRIVLPNITAVICAVTYILKKSVGSFCDCRDSSRVMEQRYKRNVS